MFECKLVYRFSNGEVEGFKGCGFSAETARQDALNQIGRKVAIVRNARKNGEEFEHSRLSESFHGLTPNEDAQVKRDWGTNVRY